MPDLLVLSSTQNEVKNRDLYIDKIRKSFGEYIPEFREADDLHLGSLIGIHKTLHLEPVYYPAVPITQGRARSLVSRPPYDIADRFGLSTMAVEELQDRCLDLHLLLLVLGMRLESIPREADLHRVQAGLVPGVFEPVLESFVSDSPVDVPSGLFRRNGVDSGVSEH